MSGPMSGGVRKGASPSMSVGAIGGGGRPGTEDRRRVVWVTVAVLTAVVTALFCGSQAWAMANRHTATRTYAMTHHGVRTVEIYGGVGSVRVVPGGRDRVEVAEKLVWSKGTPRVDRTWVGDTLQVRTGCPGTGFVLVQALQCQVALVVTVPAAASVYAATSAGTVDVRGVVGDVTTRTGSGSTRLEGLRGAVDARTGSGEITGDSLESARTTARAGSGSVLLGYAAAPAAVTVVTGSGSAEVVVPPGGRYRTEGATGSGSRTIAPGLQDPGATGVLDLSAGSGSVSVHYR